MIIIQILHMWIVALSYVATIVLGNILALVFEVQPQKQRLSTLRSVRAIVLNFFHKFLQKII